MWRNKKLLFGFALLIVAAFGLAACQAPAADAELVAQLEAELAAAQAAGESTAEELAAIQAELDAAQAGPAVVGGECCDVYRIGIFEDPLTTNFWNYYGPGSSVWTQYVIGDIAGSLYTLSDQRFDFVPNLAVGLPEEPVQEGDFFTITVPMRTDAIWSDGTPITAQDVVFTFDTCRDLQLTSNWPNSCRPEVIDRVEAVDDNTVKFFFTAIPGLAQWQFGAAQGAILPKHFWEATVAEASAAIEGVTTPEAERPADCAATGLSADETAACAA